MPPSTNSRAFDIRLDAVRRLVEPLLSQDFFFVNIGANDGIQNDPIFPFASEYAWRGVAVEPDPDVFERLRANYRTLSGVTLERAAIVPEPAPFYRIGHGPFERAYWMDQISCVSETRLREVIGWVRCLPALAPVPGDVEHYIERLDVPCLTFDELVARHRIDRIDYLNIDIEGLDVDLLATIDLDRFKNRLLCIEMDPTRDARAAAAQRRLESMGYRAHPGLMLFSIFYVRN